LFQAVFHDLAPLLALPETKRKKPPDAEKRSGGLAKNGGEKMERKKPSKRVERVKEGDDVRRGRKEADVPERPKIFSVIEFR
jgi:hypothetical protein